VLDQSSAAPVIIAVVDGSPADRVGLRAGDIIVAVDDVETARMPEDELVDRIRGEPGTVVSLGIERPGVEGVETLRVARGDVEIEPVTWAMAPGAEVAVIRVVQFSVGSGFRLRTAVQDAVEAGATGLVLDLRGNPGGLVVETLNAASAFLDDGVVYLERGRDDQVEPVRVEPGRVVDATIPLVVLIDYGTASSAEILAAALRDNGRATLVGERTFGTGTILNTKRLSDGSALRLGVQEWLTPAGQAVFRVGVEPDEEEVLPHGAVRLGPGDLVGLTPAAFAESEDVPLRRAVALAQPGG
jgi:carboxyl-terminal processing protease